MGFYGIKKRKIYRIYDKANYFNGIFRFFVGVIFLRKNRVKTLLIELILYNSFTHLMSTCCNLYILAFPIANSPEPLFAPVFFS
jgi:hypothetical protein